jgi:hypothetical protein
MFDVPWNVPVPVSVKGHESVPWVAKPLAAQGIAVSLWVATMVPTNVVPLAHVA